MWHTHLRKKKGNNLIDFICFIFSKEQLQLAIEKKKICNAKALVIVEELIDPIDDSDKFVEKVFT